MEPFDLATTRAALRRDGTSELLSYTGPPHRIDGYEAGAPTMSSSPHHAGEMHPDGDELLMIVSGRVTIVLEEEAGERRVEVAAGQGFIVPRGTWHRVEFQETSQVVYVTPGPNGEHRPLA